MGSGVDYDECKTELQRIIDELSGVYNDDLGWDKLHELVDRLTKLSQEVNCETHSIGHSEDVDEPFEDVDELLDYLDEGSVNNDSNQSKDQDVDEASIVTNRKNILFFIERVDQYVRLRPHDESNKVTAACFQTEFNRIYEDGWVDSVWEDPNSFTIFFGKCIRRVEGGSGVDLIVAVLLPIWIKECVFAS